MGNADQSGPPTAVDQAAHADLLQTLYRFPVAVMQVAPSGEITFMNPRASQLLMALGLMSQFHDGWALLASLAPDLAERARARETALGAVATQARVQARDTQGASYHLALTVDRVTPQCCLVVIEDVTRLVEQERELQRQRAQLIAVLEAIKGYFVCDLDLQGQVLGWNLSVRKTLGWEASDLVGRPLSGLLAPDLPLSEHLDAAQRTGWSAFEGAIACAHGGHIWADMVLTAVVDDEGHCKGYCLVARDISDRHREELALRATAHQDPLTGLTNRRGLEALSETMLAEADRSGLTISIAAIDIDHFKRVNDTWGHAAGDAVLQHVARVMAEQVRDSDVLARVGGEEFVLLMRGLDMGQASTVLNRIRLAVERQPCAWRDQSVPCTLSAGVAQRQPGGSLSHEWDRADQALYAAKQGGRNRVVPAV